MAKSAKKTATRKASSKKAKASARKATVARGPRRTDEAKLTWLTKENPNREPSAAFKMFEAAKTCKTVGDVKKKVAKLMKRPGHDSNMLRYWVKRGALRIA